tara:strand:+ start:959 stop:1897 length:939 start_codon:yes stop_codon:yes gene_type:complete
MARKKLLSEGEVRQFMKLANLGSLSENYFSNNPLDEQLPPEEEELEMGAEEAPGAEAPMDDAPFPDEEGAEDLEGGEENEELLARVVRAVADELGVEADIEGVGDEGGEELEVDAELGAPGDEEELDMAMSPEEEEPVPGNTAMYQEGFSAPKSASGSGPTNKAGNTGRSDVANKASGRWLKEEEEEGADDSQLNEIAELGLVVSALGKLGLTGAGAEALAVALGGLGVAGGALVHAIDRASEKADPKWTSAEFQPDEPGVGAGAAVGGGLSEEAIVAEVSRRVARRLTADKRKENMASQLTDRIFNRLTAK